MFLSDVIQSGYQMSNTSISTGYASVCTTMANNGTDFWMLEVDNLPVCPTTTTSNPTPDTTPNPTPNGMVRNLIIFFHVIFQKTTANSYTIYLLQMLPLH